MNETLRTIDGRPVLRIERRFDHPVEKVWRAVTEPEQLSQWYPFQVTEMDFRVGGKIMFDDGAGMAMEATIVELDPPRVFAFSEHAPEAMTRESDDLVHIELQPNGDGCLLVFTHTFDDRPAAASYATGWNACLDALGKLLTGKPVEFDVDFATEHEKRIKMFGLDEGSSEVNEDGWRIRFERQLTKPIEDVWTELIASGSNGNSQKPGDPPPDGFANPTITPGSLIEIDAPNALEYEWLHNDRPAGRVRWELTDGTGPVARLVVTQTGPSDLPSERREAIADAWQERIERLARHLAGIDG